MRIAIVNDMTLAREALRRVVLSVPGMQLAWMAADGAEAIEHALRDSPDLILMDLFMPKVDGAEATRQIMAARPCAILVVTATVTGHIDKVYEAMGHGALDAVDTPTMGPRGDVRGVTALVAKIETIAKLLGRPLLPHAAPTVLPSAAPVRKMTLPLVLLGASTGGPTALKQIIVALPRQLGAGVLIVQHVDMAFAPGLVSWLNESSALPVELIQEGRQPEPNCVLVANTNDHLILDDSGVLRYTAEPSDECFRPSVDVFFRSVAHSGSSAGVAALLTGMGRDGADGLLHLRQHGWYTIAQDQETSVVWGMPRAAAECGAAERVLPLPQIAAAVLAQLGH